MLRVQWQPKIGYRPLSPRIPRDAGKGLVIVAYVGMTGFLKVP